MKLAKTLAEEIVEGFVEQPSTVMVNMVADIIAAKLGLVKTLLNDLVRVAGELSHYPVYGINIGAHSVDKTVEKAKYDWGEMIPRIEAIFALLSEE